MWYLFRFWANANNAQAAGENIFLTKEAVRSSEKLIKFENSPFHKPENHNINYLKLILVLLSS
jgi:hypothetical protein